MDTKLIFFDIDGTLLDEQTFTVPDSTKKAIQLAQQNGHKCFINTGRPISTIDQVITDIPFDGYICGCGTYIEYHGEPIFHVDISDELRQKIIQKTHEYHVDTVLEGRYGVYFPEVSYHPFVQGVEQRYIKEKFPVHKYNQNDVVPFDKFASWYTKESDIEAFRTLLADDFDIIQRDVDFLEIVPLPYSKATGIQFIADYLHISIDDTISIGDSTNDLPMLKFTKEAVAMGNSNPLLFDEVTYITTDIQDNGIYNALKHFQII